MDETPHPEPVVVSAGDFFSKVPPNRVAKLSDQEATPKGSTWRISIPQIWLWCNDPECGDETLFRSSQRTLNVGVTERSLLSFLQFTCTHCEKTQKWIAVVVHPSQSGYVITKLGELPPFGPPLPTDLLKMLGTDAELFRQGYSSETQGFGIGAFTYYRRVVDAISDRLIAEIGRVAEETGCDADTRQRFRDAASAHQFKRAMDLIKDAIPQSLKRDGHHNPLSELYAALSNAVHEMSDEECLDCARAIRLVLADLAKNIRTALEDRSELRAAIEKIRRKP